jgi:hypothetical protein
MLKRAADAAAAFTCCARAPQNNQECKLQRHVWLLILSYGYHEIQVDF